LRSFRTRALRSVPVVPRGSKVGRPRVGMGRKEERSAKRVAGAMNCMARIV